MRARAAAAVVLHGEGRPALRAPRIWEGANRATGGIVEGIRRRSRLVDLDGACSAGISDPVADRASTRLTKTTGSRRARRCLAGRSRSFVPRLGAAMGPRRSPTAGRRPDLTAPRRPRTSLAASFGAPSRRARAWSSACRRAYKLPADCYAATVERRLDSPSYAVERDPGRVTAPTNGGGPPLRTCALAGRTTPLTRGAWPTSTRRPFTQGMV